MKSLNQPARRFSRLGLTLTLVFTLGFILLFWPTRALRSENFVFYFPGAHHVIPLEAIEGERYLPLMQVLNLVGKVRALQEKRRALTVWFGEVEVELRLEENTVRVGQTRLTLERPVRTRSGQWMVPTDFLITVLPHLTREPIEYQEGTSRIFIGDVKPTSFTVRLDPIPNGARVTVQFTEKVTLRTAASDGRWYLFLGDRPVEPLESVVTFSDPFVNELRFDDQDGMPKLVISPAAEGLNFYPTLAEGGKIVVADVMKPPPRAPEQARVPQEPQAAEAEVAVVPFGEMLEEAPTVPGVPHLPVVVLDAGHGGNDFGARSRDAVLEKNLVAQLVARIRLAVLAAKQYRVVLTRVGDTNPGFDERAVAANLARPVAFFSFHAGNLGITAPRVIAYTYQVPAHPLPPEEDLSKPFIPWAKVQQIHLDRSRELAIALHQQFAQIPGVTADRPAEAPVRVLRSVNAPAVAIEIGSLSPEENATALTDPVLQNQIATAIVRALEAFRRIRG